MGDKTQPEAKPKQVDYPQNKLYEALFKFQGKALNISKTTKGYGYMYAALDSVADAIRPVLQECDLMYMQFFKGDNSKFVTRVIHVPSGQMRDTELEISKLDASAGKMNSLQALGATITYIRRYTLMLALGLITEEDTDGTVESKQETKKPYPTKTQQAPAQRPTPAPKVDQAELALATKMMKSYEVKIAQIENLDALEETRANFETYVKDPKQPFTEKQVQELRRLLDNRHATLQSLEANLVEDDSEDVSLTQEEMDAIQ